jgi:hypothetical protein
VRASFISKAALISWLVLALTTSICNPMARAADCMSLNVLSVGRARFYRKSLRRLRFASVPHTAHT